jgi:hypothetical protein
MVLQTGRFRGCFRHREGHRSRGETRPWLDAREEFLVPFRAATKARNSLMRSEPGVTA